MPVYEIDPRLGIHREKEIPPNSTFIGLGFDPEVDSKKRHYRKFYPDELENNKDVIRRKPFHEYQIIKGQTRGLKKGFFGKNKTDDGDNVSNLM
jgi:hypothetical protein